jgi:YVTN family beta-propeller protein
LGSPRRFLRGEHKEVVTANSQIPKEGSAMTNRKFSRKRFGQALGLLALCLVLLVGSAEYGSADYGRTGGSSPMMGIAKDQETAIFSVEKLQLDMAQASQPDIAMSPPVFEFGPVIVGETKAGRVRVLNVGQAELVINSATLAGFPGAIVGFAAPLKLAPGAEAELQIDFKPTVEGTLKGTLEIASNDPDEPKVSITLRGAGVREITDLTVSANTTWKGDIFARNITIAKGVTITATEELTVYATGNVQIDGELVAGCHAIRIFVDQKAVFNGRIQNQCSVEQVYELPSSIAPGITFVASGGLILAGPVTAMGDPVVVSHQFLIPSAKELSYLLSPTSGEAMSDFRGTPSEEQDANNQPESYDVEIRAPISAVMGGNPLLMWQDQDVLVVADITAGDGLPGLPGKPETVVQMDAQGGTVRVRGANGANAGSVVSRIVGARGQVNVGSPGGPPVVVRGGNGGNGGPARAGGNRNSPNAEANGGNGGNAGSVWLIAPGAASMNIVGPVTLRQGDGGAGGSADAIGAGGEDGCPPKDGGKAVANGGNGGKAGGNVEVRGTVRGLQNVTVAGGKGGKGGNATATGGKGGNSTCCKKGGKGGDATARGGKGGDVNLDTRGYPVQVAPAPSFQGGDGGDATARGGNGGAGAPPGDPGKASAKGGEPGIGRVVHPPAVQRRDGTPGITIAIPGVPGSLQVCLPRWEIDLVFGIIPGWKDCEFFTLSVGQLADALTGGEFLAAAHQNLNSLAIIDLASRQLKMISVGSQPHSVEMTPDGRRAFVGNFGSGDISVVDIPNQRVIETVRVGNQTVALSFDPKTNKLYAVNFGDSNVSIVQYREGGSQVVGTVRGLREPIYVTLSPDGRRGYVSSQRRGQDIVVFDTASTNIVGRIPVPNMELRKLAVSPDGKRLYAAARTDAQGTGRIAVIDTANLQIVQQIPVEAFPLALTVTPSGACLIVTHSFVNKVSFIDLKTEKVLAVLPSGQTPQAVAIGGELAYVTNLESDAISVYNVGSCQ